MVPLWAADLEQGLWEVLLVFLQIALVLWVAFLAPALVVPLLGLGFLPWVPWCLAQNLDLVEQLALEKFEPHPPSYPFLELIFS